MIAAIKAELLKLFTVRSTYVTLGITLALIGFVCGYVEGFRVMDDSLVNPRHLIDSVIVDKLPIAAVLVGVVLLVQFAHEYRYNTILYSLTTVRSKAVYLGAKIVVASGVAVAFMTLAAFVAVLSSLVGISLAGKDLVSQTLPDLGLIARVLLSGWLYAMIGLIYVALSRNQVFSVVAYLFVPSTIEPLLGLLLRSKAVYLPYSTIDGVMYYKEALGGFGRAALWAVSYIVILWAVAWVLFYRRDAN